MIDKIWSGRSKLYWLLLPLSFLYGAVSGLRRLLFRCGLKKSRRMPVPVVVVGNLTAGGNGKTPVVIWLTEQLLARGYHPGVVSGVTAVNRIIIRCLSRKTRRQHRPVMSRY